MGYITECWYLDMVRQGKLAFDKGVILQVLHNHTNRVMFGPKDALWLLDKVKKHRWGMLSRSTLIGSPFSPPQPWNNYLLNWHLINFVRVDDPNPANPTLHDRRKVKRP